MPKRTIVSIFAAGMVLTAAAVMLSSILPVLGAPMPADTAGCLRTSEELYKQAERLEKRTRSPIPREFARVAANLDEYCEGKEFEKARISIEWMETCIKNYTKPYRLGFCTRSKTYFCAIDPASDACKG
jgi:hypothetical protein